MHIPVDNSLGRGGERENTPVKSNLTDADSAKIA
jgi:hypothetical protein